MGSALTYAAPATTIAGSSAGYSVVAAAPAISTMATAPVTYAAPATSVVAAAPAISTMAAAPVTYGAASATYAGAVAPATSVVAAAPAISTVAAPVTYSAAPAVSTVASSFGAAGSAGGYGGGVV